jgi:uncharacterized membrane protein
MAEQVEQETEVREPARDSNTRQVRQVTTTSLGGTALVARIIWYIAGVLEVILAFRFVLALLGANTSNGFANFIYNISHPFVAPFFSLFGYKLHYGVSHFEIDTLVAMLVYLVVAWGLVKLVTISQPE